MNSDDLLCDIKPSEWGRARLVACIAKIYCRYYRLENAIAYIDGRNYRLVLAFLKILVHTLDAQSESEFDQVKSKICDLDSAVTLFHQESEASYPKIVQMLSNTCDQEQCERINLVPFESFKDHYFHIARFHEAYVFCQHYFAAEILDAMLIEFNNYLSHLVAMLLGDRDGGLGHLSRGALDGYKEILAENMPKITLNDELLKLYIKIRCLESSTIGKKISDSDRKEIVQNYRTLTKVVAN